MVVLKKKVAIIGAGSAGMNAYRAAIEHTDSVVLIESDQYGTMCARTGCMPSKLLIAAADHAHVATQAFRFGVHVSPPAVDGVAVMKRVREERDRFVGFVVDTVESWPDQNRVMGHARFVAPGTLQVGDHTLVEAERIVIATGSKPYVPSQWRETLGDRLILNDDIFYWNDLPESVLVVGSGVIALELAQALSRLGVRIRVLSRNQRIASLTDPAVLKSARAIIKSDLPFSDDSKDIQLRREGDQVHASWNDDSGEHQESFEFVLAATGRTPNLAALDIANANLSLDKNGSLPFDRRTTQIGNSPVFLAGDAQDDFALLHEAADDGRIAGRNAALWPDVLPHDRRTPLSIVFSDPQIAVLGMSHAELIASGHDFVIGEVDWGGQGRARVAGQNRGLLRVYGEKSNGKLIGAEMIGPRAEHIAHLLAWCIQLQLSTEQILALPFYHPVFEEGVRTAIRDLNHHQEMSAAK